jgi:predicted ferric reductase
MPGPSLRVPLLAAAWVGAVLAWAWPSGIGAWRSAGVLAGWAGAALLVASTLLIVRDPRLARALGGVEAMLHGHHICGTLGYALLLLHPLALALDEARQGADRGWALLDPRGQGPALWLGWVALLLLMAALATTFSLHLAWRRWRGWHRMLGPAVLLGLLHVALLLGATGPWPWLLAAALLALAWRRGALDRGLTARPYRVTAVDHPAAQVVEATLAPLGGALALQPGQFVLLDFEGAPGLGPAREFHPITVSAIEPGGVLRVAIKALGPWSTRVQALQPGALARVQGPFGDFRPDASPAPRLWVAGGIGITPFVAALRGGPPAGPVTLIYLVRDPASAAFADELAAMARALPNLTLHLQTSRDAAADLPALLDRVPGLATHHVSACGPAPLVDALRAALAARGVPASALQAERFDFR